MSGPDKGKRADTGTQGTARHARNLACAACGVVFVPKRLTAKYCSKRCRQAAYHSRETAARHQNLLKWST